VPLVDDGAGGRATVAEVEDDEDVAFGVDTAELETAVGGGVRLPDRVLEEPEAGGGVTARLIAIEAEIRERVAVLGIGSREGVLDVVLVLDAAALPEPRADVIDVLGVAAGEDVVVQVEAVRDEPRAISTRCPGLDLVPVVGQCRTGVVDGIAVELEEVGADRRRDRRGKREGEVLEKQRQHEERGPRQGQSPPLPRAQRLPDTPRRHDQDLPIPETNMSR
jgi:hypothetical protein